MVVVVMVIIIIIIIYIIYIIRYTDTPTVPSSGYWVMKI